MAETDKTIDIAKMARLAWKSGLAETDTLAKMAK